MAKLLALKHGLSLAHRVIRRGDIEAIPARLWTSKLLGLADRNGRTVLLEVAAKGRLDLLPRDCLTSALFLQPDKLKGQTPALLAARYGQVEFLPPGMLTKALFLKPDNHGRNMGHAAALGGHLDQFPSAWMTPDVVCHLGGKPATSIAHILAAKGDLLRIPAAVRTEAFYRLRDGLGDTIGHKAIHRIESIPAKFITREFLALRNKDGMTIAHAAARGGVLDKLPAGLLTPDMLRWGAWTRLGSTVAHSAALSGRIDQIPARMLTMDLLTKGGAGNWTPAHIIAIMETLDRLPRALLTTELLSTAESDGHTVAHLAAARGQLACVPPGLITRRLIQKTTEDGDTVLWFAAQRGYLHHVPEPALTREFLLRKGSDRRTPLSYLKPKDRAALLSRVSCR